MTFGLFDGNFVVLARVEGRNLELTNHATREDFTFRAYTSTHTTNYISGARLCCAINDFVVGFLEYTITWKYQKDKRAHIAKLWLINSGFQAFACTRNKFSVWSSLLYARIYYFCTTAFFHRRSRFPILFLVDKWSIWQQLPIEKSSCSKTNAVKKEREKNGRESHLGLIGTAAAPDFSIYFTNLQRKMVTASAPFPF